MGVQAKHIAVEPGLCTGCSICELVCSFTKFRMFSPTLSMIRISYNYRLGRVEGVTVCTHCGGCTTSCPTGAIRADNGIVTVKYDLCVGCLTCVKACPNDAIRVINGRPYICDLCGGSPRCVKYCTRGALRGP